MNLVLKIHSFSANRTVIYNVSTRMYGELHTKMCRSRRQNDELRFRYIEKFVYVYGSGRNRGRSIAWSRLWVLPYFYTFWIYEVLWVLISDTTRKKPLLCMDNEANKNCNCWNCSFGFTNLVATGYGLHDRAVGVDVPVAWNFQFSTSFTQSPKQWPSGALSQGLNSAGEKLISHQQRD